MLRNERERERDGECIRVRMRVMSKVTNCNGEERVKGEREKYEETLGCDVWTGGKMRSGAMNIFMRRDAGTKDIWAGPRETGDAALQIKCSFCFCGSTCAARRDGCVH